MAMGDTEIVELTTGVYARLHEGLTNSGIIVSEDGVLVIDSLRVPSFGRELIKDVRRISEKPIRYVINTHSHWDHSWGNEEFPQSTIIGHTNCRQEMLDTEITVRWRDKVVAAGDPWSVEAKSVEVTPPDLTFDRTLYLDFGGRAVDLHWFGRAHTSGDIFIHLPEDRILFTGDVAQDGGIPFMGDGYMLDWPETDARLLDLDVERFVGGHGPVGERSALFEARDFIVSIVSGTERAIISGQEKETAVSSVKESLSGQFSGWRRFEFLEDGIERAYDQILEAQK